MSKREFLMLAHEYDPKKHDIGHWYVSEKLDGQRAFWDGGISRGMLASEVPYANTTKDGRYVHEVRATGLWSRYGKVIHASSEWLDALPRGVNLDMELWMGVGTFQLLRTVTSTLVPSVDAWREVTGHVLDSPGWLQVLMDGELTGPNWQGWLGRSMMEWVQEHSDAGRTWSGLGTPDECFRSLRQMRELSPSPATWKAHAQTRLKQHPDDARFQVVDMLHEVTSNGGEGLILRRAQGPWIPKRSWDVLKVKKLSDMEGTVIGFTWGRETDKGSKLLGMMGNLVLLLDSGKRLEISGFTNEERSVRPTPGTVGNYASNGMPAEALVAPGKQATILWEPVHFDKGSRVTFTYRELTDDGIPKEARYLRKRDVE